jgi:hypothetical protein
MNNGLEGTGSGRELFGGIIEHFPGKTAENHEKPQWGQYVSRPRFERAPYEHKSAPLPLQPSNSVTDVRALVHWKRKSAKSYDEFVRTRTETAERSQQLASG